MRINIGFVTVIVYQCLIYTHLTPALLHCHISLDDAKTIDNVTKWMQDSCAESAIVPEDWGQLSADSGSHAIGLI